jgi:hypothetical protein
MVQEMFDGEVVVLDGTLDGKLLACSNNKMLGSRVG